VLQQPAGEIMKTSGLFHILTAVVFMSSLCAHAYMRVHTAFCHLVVLAQIFDLLINVVI